MKEVTATYSWYKYKRQQKVGWMASQMMCLSKLINQSWILFEAKAISALT